MIIICNKKLLLKRKKFINYIYKLEKENKNIKFSKKITWDNKELYLYNLYMTFLDSLIQKINGYKKVINNNSVEYHKIFESLILETDIEKRKEKLNELGLTGVCEGEFINIYIKNLREFLIRINNNFNKRFKNYKFDSEDKFLFEDFIQFLSSYKFGAFFSVNASVIEFWNETFCPLNIKEKQKLINKYNDFYDNQTFVFELENNTLFRKKDNDIKDKIEDIDDYVLSSLLADLHINNPIKIEYYLIKNLKPNLYKEKLFVMKNKNVWLELTRNILSSNAIKEAVDMLFSSSYIDILSEPNYLLDIINNIRFFIYDTDLYAFTNENSLVTYEFGLYSMQKTISESLLSFYAFNIVSNIHEISGHFNIRFQNLNSLKKNFNTPKLERKNYNLHSKYAKERTKESREILEIILFGRAIHELTTKEALFILDPFNYLTNNNKYLFKKIKNFS